MNDETLAPRTALPLGTCVLGQYVLDGTAQEDDAWVTFTAHHQARTAERFRVRAPSVVVRTRIDWLKVFLRQRNAVVGIRHDGLVPLVIAGTERHVPVSVTPELQARTLEDLLNGALEGLPPLRVVSLVTELASVLDALARAATPVVHRLLEPSRVLLAGADERVRLLDAGLAHAIQLCGATPDEAYRAAPRYRAPEDTGWNDAVTPAADQFVLATLAFECFTGQAAFPSGPPTSRDGSARRLPMIAVVNSDLPPEIDAVLARAWSADPRARFASAREFAAALERVVGDSPSLRLVIAATPAVAPAAAPAVVPAPAPAAVPPPAAPLFGPRPTATPTVAPPPATPLFGPRPTATPTVVPPAQAAPTERSRVPLPPTAVAPPQKSPTERSRVPLPQNTPVRPPTAQPSGSRTAPQSSAPRGSPAENAPKPIVAPFASPEGEFAAPLPIAATAPSNAAGRDATAPVAAPPSVAESPRAAAPAAVSAMPEDVLAIGEVDDPPTIKQYLDEPVVPPVAPPAAVPVAAPVAAPVTPPVAPLVTPPVAAPVAAPVAPPVAAPATPPLAPPATPPVASPVAAPSAAALAPAPAVLEPARAPSPPPALAKPVPFEAPRVEAPPAHAAPIAAAVATQLEPDVAATRPGSIAPRPRPRGSFAPVAYAVAAAGAVLVLVVAVRHFRTPSATSGVEANGVAPQAVTHAALTPTTTPAPVGSVAATAPVPQPLGAAPPSSNAVPTPSTGVAAQPTSPAVRQGTDPSQAVLTPSREFLAGVHRQLEPRIRDCAARHDYHGREVRARITFDGATGAARQINVLGVHFALFMNPCVEQAIRDSQVPPLGPGIWTTTQVFRLR